MTVWITFFETSDLVPYEGKTWKHLDRVWSTHEKAKGRIKQLFDEWMNEHFHPEYCKECPAPCSNHTVCFYYSIESPNENTVTINEDEFTRISYFIEEREVG